MSNELHITETKPAWRDWKPLGANSSALAKVRRIVVDADAAERAEKAKLGCHYDRKRVENGWFPDGHKWSPDPTRRTATHWKAVPNVIDMRRESFDKAGNVTQQSEDWGSARVRLLADDHMNTRLGRGSVVEIGLFAYANHVHRTANFQHPTAEPVSDDEPLLALPIVVMSSDFNQARETAARALEVKPDTLTVRQVWEFYAKRKVKREDFHGV